MRRAVLAVLVSVLPVLVALACARPEARANATVAAAPADTLPRLFSRALVGTAGEERIEAWIRREDDRLHGTWRGDGAELTVGGTLGADGAVTLQLTDEEGGAAGAITGTLSTDAAGLALRGRLAAPGAEPRDVALAEERAELDDGVALVPETYVDEDAERGWSILAQYPVAAGASLAQGHRAYNAAIDSAIRAEVEPFRASVLEHEKPPELEVGSYYESSYDVRLAEGGIASIAFDVSAYFAGAAHPNHGTWTLTWDFDAGRAITLDMMFRPDAAWLETLSDYSIPALVSELGQSAETSWIEDGAGPDRENYASWTLERDGLRFVFDPYQVASYAAGPQEVVVPWSALEPMLDPAGPVARIER